MVVEHLVDIVLAHILETVLGLAADYFHYMDGDALDVPLVLS